MLKVFQNYPLYPIGVVSEILAVHPETIRTWEKSGVVQPPQRRSGKRFYSERDFKRLRFIQRLVEEGLTLRAIHHYLRLYPCWKPSDCVSCVHASDQISSVKSCWQEPGTYCRVANSQDPCTTCNAGTGGEQHQITETKPDTASLKQDYHQPEFDRSLDVAKGH